MSNIAGNLEALCSKFYENIKQKENLTVLRFYMQKEETAKQTISFLNNNVNRNDTCHKGLTILNELVKFCSPSLLKENCSFWLKSCCSKSGREQAYLSLKLELIGKHRLWIS